MKEIFPASAVISFHGLERWAYPMAAQLRPQTKSNSSILRTRLKTRRIKFTSDQINDEEGIEAEQVVVKTDQGYVNPWRPLSLL